MTPTLSNGGIYFLSEAPGRDEDENTGRPLTGPSGRLLRGCIPEGEEEYCSFDNVVNCRPENNRTPIFTEVECCRPRRAKFVEEAKPLLIVGLGAVPLHTILGSTDMQGMRGRVFAIKVGNHKCWFLPTYHPSFILRTARNKRKPLNSMMGHCLKMDIKRAFKLLDVLKPARVDDENEIRSNIQYFDGGDPNHFKSVNYLLDKAIAASVKAIDIETKGLRPYSTGAAIMTIAISFGTTNFAFATQHPGAKWAKNQLDAILEKLASLLTDDTTKVAHNSPFELEWFIWLYGKGVVNHVAWEDTQVQAHIIDERRGKQTRSENDRKATYQSLDFLIKQYFGIAYKSLFKLNKKDMSKSDLSETLIYNAVDTKYTLALHHTQRNILIREGLLDAYLEALPRQPTVALMQSIGIGINQGEAKQVQKRLEGEIKPIEEQINNLEVIIEFNSNHREKFSPASSKDVLEVFRDYLECPEVRIEERGKIRYSTDKGVLDQIDHPLAKLILDYRNHTKLKSTYCDGLILGERKNNEAPAVIFPDGRVHCSFNTTFAETGRTSSDEPNMQNFPQRKDAWVRNQIEANGEGVIVAFDYGQLEGCTGAMCSKDKVLVKALWDDYDIHMEWAIKLADKYPQILDGGSMKDPATAKTFRSKVKNKLVFPAMFGAQTSSIAGYLKIPEEPIIKLMDEFWDTFSGLKKWQDNLMEFYYEHGYVASPTGRRRHYPLTRNKAINHPIQSIACDIVCDSMNRLSYMAATEEKWYLHPVLNIHDDLTFLIPDKDAVLEDAIQTIYKTMLSPPYKCVNVPLSVTCSIGKRWYKMEEIGKFWSHKDL